MKKLYLVLLSVFALLNTVIAQKLSVESFVLASTDITAQTEGRKDLNGDACALVKVFVVGDVFDVEGNVVKPLVKKNSQIWAYLTQGSKQMQIIVQNALPLMVTFADYGIEKLESNRTYVLTLNQVGLPASNSVPSKSPIISIPVKDGISIDMVKVEAGSFDMGATPEMENPFEDEKPVHRVTLTKNYYVGKYEVTQALWKAVMGSNPSDFKGDNLPVEEVSWNDCQNFISKLNSMTGKRFRLPTEAEWEYAARGGKKSRGYQYSGSNTLGDVAWYEGNSGSKTHTVGTKHPNELGIYDMSGNVSEWCQDRYGGYSSSSQTNPTGAVGGSNRVFRDGRWNDSAGCCRSSYRNDNYPVNRYGMLGLRLVLSE